MTVMQLRTYTGNDSDDTRRVARLEGKIYRVVAVVVTLTVIDDSYTGGEAD